MKLYEFDINQSKDYLKRQGIDNPSNSEIALQFVRTHRDGLLCQTDWQAGSDLTMTAEQTTYRQKLRDLPTTVTPELDENDELTGVTWPTKPEAPGAISSGGSMLRGANGSTVQEWVHGSRATVSPSHTTMYSWYKLVSPGGYSSAGTPGVWEIHCHIAGGHASSAILQKFTLVQSNNHAHIADHGGANHSLCYRFCNIAPGGGAYGVSLTVNCYYLSTGAGNNGATFFFKCTHAAREPHFTFYAKYIGGTGAGIGNYEQSLSFLGTQSNNNHQPEHKTEIPITVTQ